MIKQLKTNIPLVFAFAILFVGGASLQIFMNADLSRYSFFKWYSNALNFISENKGLDYILSVILIVLVGYVLNRVFNKTSFYQKTTGFPLFIYVVLISTFEGFYFEVSLLIDLCFALAIMKIVDLDQNKSAIHMMFKSGMLFGIVFLFSYWFVPMAFVLFFSLSTFRPFQLREWVVTFVGMAIPLIYLLSFKYVLFDNFTFRAIDLNGKTDTFLWSDIVSYSLLVCIVLISLFKLLKQFKYILNIERKQINILVFFTVVTFLISAGIYWVHQLEFTIFLVPLALLLSIPILNSKSDRLMNFLFSSLIVFNLLRIFIF